MGRGEGVPGNTQVSSVGNLGRRWYSSSKYSIQVQQVQWEEQHSRTLDQLNSKGLWVTKVEETGESATNSELGRGLGGGDSVSVGGMAKG